MLTSMNEFHRRHETLWWIMLEVLAVVAVCLFAGTLNGF